MGMKKTSIQVQNFETSECIEILGRSLDEVAWRYGVQAKALTQEILREKLSTFDSRKILDESSDLLARAKNLSQKNYFEFNGKNLLSRYLSMLQAYAAGAGITDTQVVFLQSHADVGCQTVVVRDEKNSSTSFFHIEENDEDRRLVSLYQASEGGDTVRGNNELYRYRLVTWKTPDLHFLFFDYPGLVGPGPAFGINYKTDSVIMADTLMRWENPTACSLWANAVAFMFADIGDPQRAERFFSILQKKGISILGGYAIHIVGQNRSFSFEFSGDNMARVPENIIGTRRCIAQTNYPRTKTLQSEDLFNHDSPSIIDKQAAHMVKRRTKTLDTIAKTRMYPTGDAKADMKSLEKLLSSSPGDIETFDYGPVANGLANVTVTSYIAGAITSKETRISIGKLSPSHSYPLFYTPATHDAVIAGALHDLRADVVDKLLAEKKRVTVSILYSAATKRAKSTPYSGTDDDTAYVAGKVNEALRMQQVNSSLLRIDEKTIDKIKQIQADCVFNLVEWTGKDIQLSKAVFARLRELNIPVTGATEKNFMQTTDKIVAKKLFFRHGIPTPKAQPFVTGKEPLWRNLPFPLIVKPAEEHGSIGLTRSAIATDAASLKKIVASQLRQHRQPVLAEEFIDGRELLVYLLEKQNSLVMLPVEEILFLSDSTLTFQTYDSKWNPKHADFNNTRVTLAKLSVTEKKEIERVSRLVFHKLGFRGYARIDIRLKNGVPYVLEANANPNIYDSDEDQIPGIGFPDFCWEVVASALREYKKDWKI